MPKTAPMTGATGSVGSALVLALAKPDAVCGAMSDVGALFLACGNVLDQVALEQKAIDAARSARVRRVVKLSARGAAHDAAPAAVAARA